MSQSKHLRRVVLRLLLLVFLLLRLLLVEGAKNSNFVVFVLVEVEAKLVSVPVKLKSQNKVLAYLPQLQEVVVKRLL